MVHRWGFSKLIYAPWIKSVYEPR